MIFDRISDSIGNTYSTVSKFHSTFKKKKGDGMEFDTRIPPAVHDYATIDNIKKILRFKSKIIVFEETRFKTVINILPVKLSFAELKKKKPPAV